MTNVVSGVCNSPPWSRRGSRSRRRRRGGSFKVAQHPYRFPRSAPNSIRYFRHLIKPPRQTPAAQSPRLVQGGESRTHANKVPVCNSNGNLRSACISSILEIVIRTGLLPGGEG